MNLKGIVSVTGKPGLYKVVGQNKSGFILETLDEQRSKLLINPNARIAALNDITVFGEDGDLQLKAIFGEMKAQESTLPLPGPKPEGNALKEYFEKVAPGYDSDRVYTSDMKKIVGWYRLLSALPLFEEPDESGDSGEAEEPGTADAGKAAGTAEAAEGATGKAGEAPAGKKPADDKEEAS